MLCQTTNSYSLKVKVDIIAHYGEINNNLLSMYLRVLISSRTKIKTLNIKETP